MLKMFVSRVKFVCRFLDEYRKEDLKFWGITTGNEPLNGIIPINRFNSLGWSPQAHRDWIANNLGPQLKKSQHNLTKLIALDDQRFLLPWWLELVRKCN
jgi:glucosylceramidase